MKRIVNILATVILTLCLSIFLAACGDHDCVDTDKDHKCDTCEETMGEHNDGGDADHLCDYCNGTVDGDICVDGDKNHKCDECEANVGVHGDGDDADHLCDYCNGIEVFVTISNKGSLVMTQEKVLAVDKNEDTKIDIDEVLFAAHEAKYEGGAAAGYASYTGDYGLSLGTLWGDNSGSFGYYVNNASAFSLADEVADNGYVYAFVYTDATAWSDSYSFFNVNVASVNADGTVELTLSSAGYDAEWNPITVAVEGATITINGEATEYVTDADGKVTVTFDSVGEFVISATKDGTILVPPVCVVTAEAAQTNE